MGGSDTACTGSGIEFRYMRSHWGDALAGMLENADSKNKRTFQQPEPTDILGNCKGPRAISRTSSRYSISAHIQ